MIQNSIGEKFGWIGNKIPRLGEAHRSEPALCLFLHEGPRKVPLKEPHYLRDDEPLPALGVPRLSPLAPGQLQAIAQGEILNPLG